MVQFITPEKAAAFVSDEATIALGGFAACGGPDALMAALADRYRQTSHPANLTVVTGVGTGDFSSDDIGMNRIALDGMIRNVIAGHLGNCPNISKMAAANKIGAYTIPLGVVAHLFRAIAGKKPGVITHVGLGTFADPRLEGCKVNDLAKAQDREIVKVIELEGNEYLFYPSFDIDVCFIRGSYADQEGNISIERESLTGLEMEIATAVHNCGGKVIVQVEEILETGSIHPRKVRIHNSLVDYVVVAPSPELHMQNYVTKLAVDACSTGDIRLPAGGAMSLPMNIRKIIARRGAMDLKPGDVINLGIGIPAGVGAVASEEEILSDITLSLETGSIGGIPQANGFGRSINPKAIYALSDTFDQYDGGMLDAACLGAAEIDERGNVNSSKFGPLCPGPGGFINISQNTPKVNFMLSFTAGKSEIGVADGKLNIVQDATGVKFVKKLQQVTFSADYARKIGQEVKYMTERAVFRLVDEGIELIEIAPGVDLEKDILAHMEFKPLISKDLKLMDERIFREEKMGLHF